jgi:hypothetical protein
MCRLPVVFDRMRNTNADEPPRETTGVKSPSMVGLGRWGVGEAVEVGYDGFDFEAGR